MIFQCLSILNRTGFGEASWFWCSCQVGRWLGELAVVACLSLCWWDLAWRPLRRGCSTRTCSSIVSPIAAPFAFELLAWWFSRLWKLPTSQASLVVVRSSEILWGGRLFVQPDSVGAPSADPTADGPPRAARHIEKHLSHAIPSGTEPRRSRQLPRKLFFRRWVCLDACWNTGCGATRNGARPTKPTAATTSTRSQPLKKPTHLPAPPRAQRTLGPGAAA